MNVSNEAALSPLDQELSLTLVGEAACMGELFDIRARKQIRQCRKGSGMLIDVRSQRLDPGHRLDKRIFRLCRDHRTRKCIRKMRIDLPRKGQVIERGMLVEAAHFHAPFDTRPRAVKPELAVGAAPDCYDASIKLRGKHTVDSQFRFARLLAPLQS